MAWIAILLSVLEGGWMAVDGSRALIVGDYVTPRTGPSAGRLGPWSRLVSAVGIEPRSTLMKSIHVVLGVTGLALAACFALGVSWARWGLVAWAAATLWYLPVGTLLGLIQIVLLLLLEGPRASG